MVVAPSSSGPGRLVLIQKIAGSTPAGGTRIKISSVGACFCSGHFRQEMEHAKRVRPPKVDSSLTPAGVTRIKISSVGACFCSGLYFLGILWYN